MNHLQTKCVNVNFGAPGLKISPATLIKFAGRLPSVCSQVPASDNWICSCRHNICHVVFQGQPIAFLSAHVSTNVVSCLNLCEFTTCPWPLRLETLLMIFKATVSWPMIPRGPCTPRQSTASLSNPGSSYCCWQLTPVPGAGGIRWEWARGLCGGQPKETPLCPIPQQGVIRSCWREENKERETWQQVDRRGRGLPLHFIWLSKNTSSPDIARPSPASVCSLCVHLSAPRGPQRITLMTSGMGNQKHLLSEWRGDRGGRPLAPGPWLSPHHFLLSLSWI